MWFEDGLDASDRANKAALLLAHERYSARFAPFIKGQQARLSYVEDEIAAMIEQAADETNADAEKVKTAFMEFLADHMKLNPDGVPNVKNVKNDEGLEGIEKTDVMDRGEVPGAGREESLDIPKQDVMQKASCFRCEREFLSKVATPVCHECTEELKKTADAAWPDADSRGTGTGLAEPADPNIAPVDDNMLYVCQLCGQQDQRDALVAHVQQAHADVLQRQQQEEFGRQPLQTFPQASTKTAEEDEPAEVEPLPESPGDRFEEHVQALANRAAARKFSMPDEELIHSIASQTGQSPEDVKQNLVAVAMFGDDVGVNGEIGGDPTAPEGYEEVSMQQGGGSNNQQAVVPTDLVISKVAEEMNMEPDLAYNQIRDRYGADLPDKYHAQVTGEIHYYLPSQMAGNQMQQQPTDPNVGPTLQPAAPQPV